MMKPEHWQRAKEIVPAARDLPPTERSSYLDEACGDDEELRGEVEALLAADPGAVAFIERSPLKLLGEPNRGVQEHSQVGAYRIERELGRGGMGVVYLAVRTDDEFSRQVAIKVLQPELTSGDTDRRFRQEMEILANLSHPNIAKLFEGGRTEDGRLYYLMEYVEGEPIDVYCRERKLSLEWRLRLFLKVCAAVQYAHTRLVVHRDIKPSNVLVTAEGEPMLLDFGVAKPLGGAGIGATALTGGDQRLFTPDYASPEQIAGDDVHTASDVYSLGVMLYEMLAGDRPYRLRGLAEKEIRQKVCEETLPPPSTASSGNGTSAGTEEPSTADPTTEGFRKRLQGDLDTIVLMALRKAPGERYSTAQRLADDIERHLARRPIEARRPSLRYKARKFLHRNRVGVGIAGLFLALVVAAVWVSMSQYRETVRERDRAETVSRFLTDVFSHSDPQARNTPETTARELLDQAVQEIDIHFDHAPETKASLLVSLGAAHLNLGLYDQASDLLKTAVELSREHAPNSELLGDSLQAMGVLNLYTGKFQLAQQDLEEAVALRRRVLGPSNEKLATGLNTLGLLYKRVGDYAEAESYYRAALEIRRQNKGDRLGLARSLQNLGALMRTVNRYADAEVLYIEAIDIKMEEIGPTHPSTATSIHNLGRLYKDQGRYDEAKSAYRRAIAINRRSLGDLHPSVAQGLDTLGVLFLDLGEYGEAEKALLKALSIRQQTLSSNHPELASSYHNIGALRFRCSDFSEAERSFRAALAIREEAFGADHPSTLRSRTSVAVSLEMQGQLLEAEQMLLTCLQGHQGKETLDRREIARIKKEIAVVLAKVDRLDEAERYAEEASKELRAILGDQHPTTAEAESVLGRVLFLQGRVSEAEPLLRTSYEILLTRRGSDAPSTKEAAKRVAALADRNEEDQL